MGNCIPKEEIEKKNPLIIDVQQVIADDAWEEFVVSCPRKCRFLRPPRKKRSDYTIEVPMNYYHFEVVEQSFDNRKHLPSPKAKATTSKGETSQSLLEGSIPDKLGLKTEFKNDTEKDQTYNFRMEKTRTATVQVNYQRGFSIGGNAKFSVGLPKVLDGGELSAEINSTYEVTSSKGQTFQETFTTEATSEISVSRNTHCTASVVMEERRLLADFKIKVKMHMPERRAVVLIRDKTGRTVFLKVIQNLSMLFPEDTHIIVKNQPREDAVMFDIHGFVDGMQLSNHYIHLKSRKLSPPVGRTAKRKAVPKGDKAGDGDDKTADFSDLQELGYKPEF